MDNKHILELTTDYALGLLPPAERRRVEAHAQHCATCRAALQRDRSLEALVRGTVHQAARPVPARLAAVRAATTSTVVNRPRALPLHRRLAPVTLVTVLLALGLLFGRGQSPFTPAVFANGTPTLTATNTHTPTATLAAVDPTATEAAGAAVRLELPAEPVPNAAPRALPALSPTPAPPAVRAANHAP